MKLPKIVTAVGLVDEGLIAEAAEFEPEKKNRAKNNRLLRFWVPAAACLVVLAVAGAVLLPALFRGNAPMGKDPRYRDVTVSPGETAVVWDWEHLTTAERYPRVEVNDLAYSEHGQCAEDQVGESLGACTAYGYEEAGTGQEHQAEFEAFAIKQVDPKFLIAVKMEEEYYAFQKETYDPPATLGELLDAVDLANAVKLNDFSVFDHSSIGEYFALEDDGPLWEVLSTCRNAPFVENNDWVHGEKYLSFSITSPALGIYRRALYITSDGYLWTNAFDWQYLFQIGEEAAGEITRLARENASPADLKPYLESIAGTVSVVTQEYFLVDDSILCRDRAQGITYKVSRSDPRISRFFDCDIIREGDTVVVSYCGEIDPEEENLISDPVDLDEAVILDSSGEVFVPE